MQFRSMMLTYRNQFPNARYAILELNGKPIGRLITDVQPDTVYFPDIAVLPQTQRGGLATALMRVALEEARQLSLPGTVKVLSSNAASLRLCEKLGFFVASEEPPFLNLEWRP
jgi:ribosomal protein S18 acetylase RimI-like enzyme